MTEEERKEATLETKVSRLVRVEVDRALRDKLEELTRARGQRDGHPRRLAIVASKGTLDMAYPPLILATTAAAMGWEVGIFFTFYGLDILNRRKLRKLKVPSLANPAMPVPVPNILGVLPGMTAMATWMMKSWMGRARIPSVEELLNIAQASGVRLIACTTTMGVMNVKREYLIDSAVLEGASAFLDYAAGADVTVFV